MMALSRPDRPRSSLLAIINRVIFKGGLMHYFKRNLGDYYKKAGRLSMLQHGAYTLLLDACYDREMFPTYEQAIDWCWALGVDEINAVDVVLSRFFTLKDGVYIQTRIQEEIDTYHANSKINSRIAIEREAKKRAKRENESTERAKACTVEHERAPNQEPLTTNHKPITNIKRLDQNEFDHEFEMFWNSGIRKVNKKKTKPLFVKIIKSQDSPKLFAESLITDVQLRLSANQLGFAEMHPTTYLNGERWTDEKTQPAGVIHGQRKESLAERTQRESEAVFAKVAADRARNNSVETIDAVTRQQVHVESRPSIDGKWELLD